MSESAPLRLPDHMVVRAQSIADGLTDWQVPPVRDAATVVLLRDGASGLEVFLMRRVTTMAFAAGMHVFPGGAVDPDDAHVPLTAEAWDPGEVERRFTAAPGLGRALVAAAARETFEECGVLLVDADVDPHAWEGRRQSLIGGDATFSELLRDAGLAVRAAALAPWRHWVTPEVEDRRYDTRFLVAALPAGQEARDLGGEADRVRWVTPQAALDDYAGGRLPMLPPTVDVLRSLLPFESPDQAIATAADRVIRPLMPHPRRGDDGLVRWALIDAATGESLVALDDGPAGSEFHGVNP